MTFSTRFVFFLWTWLLAGKCFVLANSKPNLPPILTNPSSCGVNLFITEAGCGPNNEFKIDVTMAPGASLGTDVYLKELRFIIEHEWVADLDISLKSPNGVVVEVSSDNGDAFDHYGDPNDGNCSQFTRFIAHAAIGACNLPNIEDGIAPFIGEYLPEGNFSSFNDGSSPLGLWTLQICDDGAGNLGYLQYVELVFEGTGCVAPTEVAVLQEDSTFVQLDWVVGSGCNEVVFEFGPVGFTPGTDVQPGTNGTVVIGGCPPFILTGLQPASEYDIYLREKCGSGQFSTNACPVKVQTTCSPPSISILDNFNAQPTCSPVCGASCPILGTWRNASNDNFDWLVYADTTLTANTGPIGDNPGGGNYVYLEASGSACRNGKRAVLISNCIQVVASPDSCDMSFDYNFNGVHINGMSLEISTNGGTTWTVLWNGAGDKGKAWYKKYIDLDAYNGLTAQFRFVGRGGNGQFADLALDNIAFYGSIDLGFPDFVYYLDADGDGYGTPDFFIASCQPSSFPNYVDNDGDCNDQDFYQSPGEQEILCDDVDANCNGNDDEYFVPPVSVQGMVVCNGSVAFATAIAGSAGEISWYLDSIGGTSIATGDTLIISPNLLVNNGLDTLELVFYAEETTATGCVSYERSSVSITVLPSPNLQTNDTPGACAGLEFNLTSVNITDANGQNGLLFYYDHLPFMPGDEIGPIVTPMATTSYYAVSQAPSGCRDTLEIVYTVQPGPIAEIPDAPTLCKNSTKTISVVNQGAGAGSLLFQWNNGSQNDSIPIHSGNIIGEVKTYAVTITDAGGCSSADSLSVTTIVSIEQIVTASSPVTSCNGSDGSITLTPLSGNAPFTYTWAGGTEVSPTGSYTFQGLSQGSYAFTVTDASPEQCRAVVPTVVVNGPSAIVEVDAVQNVSCSGGNDGCIFLEVIGSPNTIVIWENGMTGESICGLNSGVYSATITDGNCENIISIPVTAPEPLIVKPNIQHVSCFSGTNGRISLTIFGGTLPLQYLWENGTTAPSLEDLAAGFYDLTVTDANNCQVVLTDIPVVQPQPLQLASIGFEQPSCFGAKDGSIEVGANGGTAPYAYAWDNGGLGSALSNIVAGTYVVTVSDQNGCELSQTVNLAQPPLVEIILDEIQPPNCAGQHTGFIAISVQGGTGGYIYHWSNDTSSEDLVGIGTGQFSVTVTDLAGCTAIQDFMPITSPEILNVEVTKVNPTCVGQSNGMVAAMVTGGGTAPYQFDWNTDDSGPQLTSISFGEYVVTVTDANGCTSIHSIILDSIQVLNLSYEAYPPLCFGQTGQLVIAVNGGAQPYEIVWSDGQTGMIASNLLAQNHAATVTDANGCKNNLGIIPLMEPPQLLVSLEDIDGIACYGGSEGAININIMGGTEPYHFNWSNGAHTEDLASISEGTYGVTITDDNTCTVTLEGLEVLSHQPLEPSSSLGLPDAPCQTIQVEEVCVSVNGGVAPYLFHWDSGDTTACVIDPLPGDYHVTITDAAGCTLEFMSIKVPEQYSAITAQPIQTGNEVVCFGEMSGQLNVSIEGGVGPFQYNWSNGVVGQTSNMLLTNMGLGVGSYRVTITDNLGCTSVSPPMLITTFGPVTPTIPSNLVSPVKCKGGDDGAAAVNVNLGLPPYSFHWEDSAGNLISMAQQANGLVAGAYYVTVTDTLGCSGNASTIVQEPLTLFQLDTAIATAVSCFGDSNGTITAFANGGALPYQFQWSNAGSTAQIEGLPTGFYQLTVTDDNGCQRTGSYFVGSPDAPIAMAVVDSAGVSCFDASDGFIEITVSGGTPGYDFSWNAFSTSEDLINAPAGQYHLMVFDTNGCTFSTFLNVGTPPLLNLSLSSTPQTENSAPNGSATAVASGGTPPYFFQWSNGQTDSSIVGLEKGDYGITLTDGNGCITTGWVFVDFISATTENQEREAISIYPNPSAGIFNLSGFQPGNWNWKLRVLNAYGQQVMEFMPQTVSERVMEIDLGSLSDGVYQIMMEQEGKNALFGRLILQK